MNTNAAANADPPPFGALAHAATRAQALLDGAWRVAWPAISGALERALSEAEAELFHQAERAPNVNQQNLCFESQRELRLRRETFLQACRDGVQRSLRQLLDAEVPVDRLRTTESGGRRRAELSLVDPAHLEEVLVLTEIATRAEMRSGDELHGLAYRLAVIAASAPVEVEDLALGPHLLCASLRVAASCFDIHPAHRHACYRRLDKSLFADAPGLYATINRYLIGEGVLPHLHLARRAAPRRDGTRGVEAPTGAAHAEITEIVVPPNAVSAREPAAGAPVPAPPDPGYAPAPMASDVAASEASEPQPPAAPAAAAARARPARIEGPAMQAFRRFLEAGPRETQAMAPATAPAVPAATAAAQDAAPGEAAAGPEAAVEMPDFDTLRELLAGHRHGGARTSADSTRTLVPASELHAALGELQTRRPEPVLTGGRLRPRSVADVKRELLAQLRSRSDGMPVQLAPVDSDAIDLVGFLFEHLVGDRPQAHVAQDLLARLQVPLIRVALQDKAFFTRREHPARQLMNNLLETADTWIDDDSQDRTVADRLRWVVDRVAREYDQDSSVFARLGEDLSRHLSSLRRKAEVSERHHVEAARGRERLDLAKAKAAQTVQSRLEGSQPPAAVRTLLESAWTDTLALTFLRLGEEHPQTQDRLEFVDRLLRLFGDRMPLSERRFELQRLYAEFESGLAAIGYHEDAITRSWKELSHLAEAGRDDVQAADQLQQLVAHQPRLGGERRDAEPAHEGIRPAFGKREARLPVGPREREMIERVKRLPFGTWCEFTLNQQGDTARRKLAWYSPVTGNCLFVNARGGKVAERTIEDLARDLVRGNVKVVIEAPHESLIDRAWKGILSMLRGGGTGAPQPA
ncbi:MAG: hypothetical protein AMXMBFR25_09640 [Lysobacterales bacterium]